LRYDATIKFAAGIASRKVGILFDHTTKKHTHVDFLARTTRIGGDVGPLSNRSLIPRLPIPLSISISGSGRVGLHLLLVKRANNECIGCKCVGVYGR
jgi:hypothetical protein